MLLPSLESVIYAVVSISVSLAADLTEYWVGVRYQSAIIGKIVASLDISVGSYLA